MPRAESTAIPENVPWQRRKAPPVPVLPSPKREDLVSTALAILKNPWRSKPTPIAKLLAGLSLSLLLGLSALFAFHDSSADRPTVFRSLFPTVLPAQHCRVHGRIYFADPNGDVSRLEFKPIKGKYGKFEYDQLVWLSRTRGYVNFRVVIYYQEGAEDGAFQIKVIDRRGHYTLFGIVYQFAKK